MRAALLAGAIAAAVVGFGCALVTDLGTTGYGGVDAGDAQTALCDGDAACTPSGLQCVAAGDCASGQICCVGLSSMSSPSFACTSGSMCGSGIQLCRTNIECTGVPCQSQQCAFGAATLTIQACGKVCNP